MTAPKSPNSSASVLKTSSHKPCRWKTAKHWFCWIPRKRWVKWCREYGKWFCCEIFVTKSKLRRVWPFGGIFCLTFFREGCSPAARLDEPLLCPGAWQVLDSTWSTERGLRGPPVVPAGWCHPHSSNESLAWLQQRFPDRPISCRCDP